MNGLGKYGDVNIDGKSMDINKLSIEKLYEALKRTENKENNLMEEQHRYLSEILK